jgi:hypothetical protein
VPPSGPDPSSDFRALQNADPSCRWVDARGSCDDRGQAVASRASRVRLSQLGDTRTRRMVSSGRCGSGVAGELQRGALASGVDVG